MIKNKLTNSICTFIFASTISTSFIACSETHSSQNLALIPYPSELKINNDNFIFSSKVSIIEDTLSNKKLTNYLNTRLKETIGYKLDMIDAPKANCINLELTRDSALLGKEGYKLNINSNEVNITAASENGLFYGIQTLLQMIPTNQSDYKTFEIPSVEIIDKPAFSWRGIMLDVSRHYQPKEYIKQFIDILAFHKINTFHWHLTDGIGWRIEIDQYPLLTEKGAFRKIKENKNPWQEFELADSKTSPDTYGGFYTKDDIKEIIEYASSRYITIIPEIEMPGHSEAATFCYPQYICKGAKPGSGIYCAGNDETFMFLQNILDEVIELFPSQYIHIGGDEVGKEQWANCPKCGERKKKEKLADEHELQSYFIKRMEKYISSKGKKLIGWDEILEGGLAENATVMSWTGQEGGIKAANSGHDVIMSPIDYCYLDHYQGYNNNEPQGWGGYNGLKRVYTFNPIPEAVMPENRKYILGGQANLWTENISKTEHLEYMLMPRLAALSEAVWNNEKDWNRFKNNLDVQFDRYYKMGYNYSNSSNTPMIKSCNFDSINQSLSIELYTELDLYPIYYTLDGSEPTMSSNLYDGSINITNTSDLKAAAFRKNKQVGYILELPNLLNKATLGTVSYITPFNEQYSGGGATALIDNKFAIKRGDDKNWQGFEKENAEFIIDLGQEQEIHEFNANFFQHIGSTSVMLPSKVSIYTSLNGNEYTLVKDDCIAYNPFPDAFIENINLTFDKHKARFVKVIAVNTQTLPSDHPRKGANAWVFIDEVSIN